MKGSTFIDKFCKRLIDPELKHPNDYHWKVESKYIEIFIIKYKDEVILKVHDEIYGHFESKLRKKDLPTVIEYLKLMCL